MQSNDDDNNDDDDDKNDDDDDDDDDDDNHNDDIKHLVGRKKSKRWMRRTKIIGMQTRGSSAHPPLCWPRGRSSRSTGPTIAT